MTTDRKAQTPDERYARWWQELAPVRDSDSSVKCILDAIFGELGEQAREIARLRARAPEEAAEVVAWLLEERRDGDNWYPIQATMAPIDKLHHRYRYTPLIASAPTSAVDGLERAAAALRANESNELRRLRAEVARLRAPTGEPTL